MCTSGKHVTNMRELGSVQRMGHYSWALNSLHSLAAVGYPKAFA
jgi:hypothetical protein